MSAPRPDQLPPERPEMTATPLPGVAVIIPAFNEESVIRQCLIAAIYQTVPARQIIVVDNNSTDRTAALVRAVQREYPHSPVELIRQAEMQGLIPTRNAGFAHATAEILGRIDADSLLEPDWVEEVQKAFADPAVAAATGPVVYYDMPMRRWGLKADDKMRQLMLRIARYQYHFLFGSNMAIRRSAWCQIAAETCLDRDDQMHEDIDLSLHLADHELAVKYVPTMVSGMSARRLEDSPRDYTYYVTRFERTYKAHNINKIALKAPMVVFFSVYFPAKVLRAMHGSGLGQGMRRPR